MKEKITIVITNYQRLNYLKKCVNSMTKHNFLNIIISSYEPTEKHYEYFKTLSPEIRVFTKNIDTGVNDLWLEGLNHVETEYVLIMHDDDYLNPEFFSNLPDIYSKLEKYKYILWSGVVKDPQDNFIWQDNILKDRGFKDNYLTGEKDSKTLLDLYINTMNMYPFSPVIQIMDTKVCLKALEWCANNFNSKLNFSREKMMLGNEIAMTIFNLRNIEKFYFYDEFMTTFGASETSETILMKDKLLPGYNQAKKQLQNIEKSNFKSKIIKIYLINPKLENIQYFKNNFQKNFFIKILKNDNNLKNLINMQNNLIIYDYSLDYKNLIENNKLENHNLQDIDNKKLKYLFIKIYP